MACQWIDKMEMIDDVSILHIHYDDESGINGGFEQKVLSYKADGFSEKTRTVYEFHGWPHNEYPPSKKATDLNMYGTPYGVLYKNTMERMQRIKAEGYIVKYIIFLSTIPKNVFKNVTLCVFMILCE